MVAKGPASVWLPRYRIKELDQWWLNNPDKMAAELVRLERERDWNDRAQRYLRELQEKK